MKKAMMWVAIAVTASCGGDGRPSVSTSEGNVCDEVAEVACFNMYQCCSEGEIEDILGVDEPRTEAQCREDARTLCERQLATLAFSIENKHVRFDAKVMNDCLDALVAPEGSCATIQAMEPWTADCMEKAWVPLVEAGGKCDFSYECVTDTFCDTNRTCTALPGNGMSCAAAQTCATGLYCDFTTGSTCRPLVAQNGNCASTAQCEKGLFCDTSGLTRTCQPLAAIGEKCSGNASCESRTCLPGRCSNNAGSCFTDASCGSGSCADDGSFCTTDGTCALGTCSNAPATACSLDANCTAPGTCVFPVKCVLPTCEGDVVCAESHELVDYCTDALSELPIFPSRN